MSGHFYVSLFFNILVSICSVPQGGLGGLDANGKAEIKSVIDDTSNQLLTQALVLLTHEASKLESFSHSHAFN